LIIQRDVLIVNLENIGLQSLPYFLVSEEVPSVSIGESIPVAIYNNLGN
jgi:hypothetical protein